MQLLSSLIKLHGMVLGALEKTGNIIIEEIIKYALEKIFCLCHNEYSNNQVNK
jgi:hypothetical protein